MEQLRIYTIPEIWNNLSNNIRRGWYSYEIFQVSLEVLKFTCIHMVTYTKTNLTYIIENLESFASEK